MSRVAPGLRVLLVAPPLDRGTAGGVPMTLGDWARALVLRGHRPTLLAPAGMLDDVPGARHVTVEGVPSCSAVRATRDEDVRIPRDGLLPRLWEAARALAPAHDVVVNGSFDWLAYYLAPFLPCPVGHVVTLCATSAVMDQAVRAEAARVPGAVAMLSRAQAATFGPPDTYVVLGSGFDLARYPLVTRAGHGLAWAARIEPGKGLADALAVAARTGLPLRILSFLEDPDHFRSLTQSLPPGVDADYAGFLDPPALARVLGGCLGLLVTPRGGEAFGNVVVESLACGTPVVAWRHGGPAEIIEEGRTGFLVEPGDLDGLCRAVQGLPGVDRAACRRAVEARFSLEAFGPRLEAWLGGLLEAAGRRPGSALHSAP